jgi:hypothetical protein
MANEQGEQKERNWPEADLAERAERGQGFGKQGGNEEQQTGQHGTRERQKPEGGEDPIPDQRQ